MVIYILRHERRNLEKCGYFTPLTSIGKHNVKFKLFPKFNEIELDEIYSSPYRRTLETVSVISQTKQIPIKIDWALSERVADKDLGDMKWPSHKEQMELHETFNINKEYSPTATIEYIDSYTESLEYFMRRVDNFVRFIEAQSDKNILIVSHQSVTDRLIEKLTGKVYHLDMGECYEIVLNK